MIFDFNVLKVFFINTRTGKVLRPLPVRWEFPSPDWVKINTDGAVRDYPGLAACGSIFRGSMREFIGVFSAFLDVQTALIAEFYGVIYMLWRKLKSWVLLMSGWNVTLPCFVLRLLLGQMFLRCFVIDEILVLITVEKSGLRLLIFFVKGMRVLISWLI